MEVKVAAAGKRFNLKGKKELRWCLESGANSFGRGGRVDLDLGSRRCCDPVTSCEIALQAELR